MIAAIIGTFDLVSIVEVRDDLRDLASILRLLGSRWSVVFSDYVRDAGGNRERVAFVFDHERVTFTGLAGRAAGPRRRVAKATCARFPGGGRRSSRPSAQGVSTSSSSLPTSGGGRWPKDGWGSSPRSRTGSSREPTRPTSAIGTS
jgi:hypothetical protein